MFRSRWQSHSPKIIGKEQCRRVAMPVDIAPETKCFLTVHGMKGFKGWVPEQLFVDGSYFMKIDKRDTSLCRAAVGRGLNTRKATRHDMNVAFIDTLQQIRTDRCNDVIREALRTDEKGRDSASYRSKRRKAKSGDAPIAPQVVDVKIPGFREAGLPSITRNVMHGVKNNPVYVEMTGANVRYITARIRYDMEHVNVGRHQRRRLADSDSDNDDAGDRDDEAGEW